MQVLELHQWLSSASVPKTVERILLKGNAINWLQYQYFFNVFIYVVSIHKEKSQYYDSKIGELMPWCAMN
jgi:hypothetical protein